ncbi:hypothetical protein D3C75_1079780 [compost metagenome]
MIPVKRERTITRARLAAMNMAKLATLAVNTLNRETGRSSVSFMVLAENSPLNMSIATKVANSGRMV